MLILSRRINESIIINDDVKIKILDVQKYQVRIGIEAPIEVPVNRKEIWLRMQDHQEKE
ncbi:MAG: carbon storage regulator CsrA [Gammaproteobacteria bacterium]|jgi:carbon storage regulator